MADANNEQVIDALNGLLRNELTAIIQYFTHSKILKSMGYVKLAEKSREESIDEMRHADLLMDRIMFLGGYPATANPPQVNIGKNPIEMLENDLELEHIAIADLQKAFKVCEETDEVGSVKLVEDILFSEEEHVEWIKQQLSLIKTLGETAWLQMQV